MARPKRCNGGRPPSWSVRVLRVWNAQRADVVVVRGDERWHFVVVVGWVVGPVVPARQVRVRAVQLDAPRSALEAARRWGWNVARTGCTLREA